MRLRTEAAATKLEACGTEMLEGDEALDEQICGSRFWETEEDPSQIQDVQR